MGTPPHKLSPASRRKKAWRPALLWTILGLTLIYLAVLTALSVANNLGPERWWWSTVNLYLPQWAWGIPALLLFAANLFTGKRTACWAVIQLAPLLWVAGPLMGFHRHSALESNDHIPSAAPTGQASAGSRLRIMTYNIEGGERDSAAVVKAINGAQPDILLIQERQDMDFAAVLRPVFPGWTIKTKGEFLILSRLPLLSVEMRFLPPVPDESWKSPSYLRCLLRSGDATIALYNVHLSTPRPALAALKEHEPDAVAELEANTATRITQAVMISNSIRAEKVPVLVAGDFNAPPPSLICQQLRQTGLQDAFAAAGQGYGYTVGHALRPGFSYVRLDHILASKHWRIHVCWPGDARGSDHRPLIAELSLHDTPSSIVPSQTTAP